MDEFFIQWDEKTRFITMANPRPSESDLRRIAECEGKETYDVKRMCLNGHYQGRWTRTAQCIKCYPEQPTN